MLAALAQATSRLRIGAMVNGMHHRHPAVTANMAATLDHISGGRFELGMGAGWNAMESSAYGIPLGTPKERSDRFEEGIEVIVSLLTKPVTNFAGEWYRLDNAWCEPKPVQDHIPIVIGGQGRQRTLRTAARFADQWDMTFPDRPSDWLELDAVLREHCESVGPRSIGDRAVGAPRLPTRRRRRRARRSRGRILRGRRRHRGVVDAGADRRLPPRAAGRRAALTGRTSHPVARALAPVTGCRCSPAVDGATTRSRRAVRGSSTRIRWRSGRVRGEGGHEVDQVAVVGHVAHVRMWPVGAPQHTIGCGGDQRPGERDDVVVRRGAARREALGTGDLDPAPAHRVSTASSAWNGA